MARSDQNGDQDELKSVHHGEGFPTALREVIYAIENRPHQGRHRRQIELELLLLGARQVELDVTREVILVAQLDAVLAGIDGDAAPMTLIGPTNWPST